MLSKTTATSTLRDVANVVLTRPAAAGALWKGIPHLELIHKVKRQLEESNLKAGPPVIHLSRGGAGMTAALTVGGLPGVRFGDSSLSPALGFDASNGRRKALTFYCGLRITDCDAGVVTHVHKAGQYTVGLDLKKTVEEAVDDWCTYAEELPRIVGELTEEPMTQGRATKLVIAAAGLGLIPSERILPIHNSFAEGDDSVWGLAVAFGTHVNRTTPEGTLERMLGFYRLLAESLVPA